MLRLVVILVVSFLELSEAQSNDVITTENVTFYLYTRGNTNDSQLIRSANLSDLPTSNFRSNRLNYFVIHGIFGDYLGSFYAKDPLLDKLDVNVFLVDYSGPASSFEIHDQAIVATGKIIADYIDLMKRAYNLVAENFILVGFSMGAHVAGEVGRNLRGDIGTIIALDPANMSPPIVYIYNNSAHYVQSVHTSGIGLRTPVGQVSFFPNTVNQPGCSGNVQCDHIRVTRLYEESLKTGGFAAVKCESYESFTAGLCNDNDKSFLGGINLDKRAYGSYYLRTNGEAPFSIGSSSGAFNAKFSAISLALLVFSLIF